jgi:hypothetical protein
MWKLIVCFKMRRGNVNPVFGPQRSALSWYMMTLLLLVASCACVAISLISHVLDEK